MWTKWGRNIQVEDLRNHDSGTVMTLRYLLNCGAKITPDPKRVGFYEVEGESSVFYVYAPTRNGKVTLLATWPRESAFTVRGREAFNKERGGHFTPFLYIDECWTSSRQLDASFEGVEHRIRARAYELYEQRGMWHGHALDDWLQAEAELLVAHTELESLRKETAAFSSQNP